MADEVAKLANCNNTLGPGPRDKVRALDALACKVQRRLVETGMLALQASDKESRKATHRDQDQALSIRAAKLNQTSMASGHVVAGVVGRYYCSRCTQGPPAGKGLLPWLCSTKCAGPPDLFHSLGPMRVTAVRPAEGGQLQAGRALLHGTHRLAWHRGVFWCWRCGQYATTAPRDLAKPCRPGRRAGKDYLRRLRKGLPPKDKMQWPLDSADPFPTEDGDPSPR